MIISRAEIESAASAYRVNVRRKEKPSAARAIRATDTFEPTSETSSLAGLRAAVLAEPFYRTDLVEDLRRRIEGGKYYVPAEQIVEKMLGRLMAEAVPV